MWIVAGCACLVGCSGRTGTSPGDVAVSYTADLFSKKTADAEHFVAAENRSDFETLSSIIAGQSTSYKDLRAGRVVTLGATSTVTLIGTICTGPPRPAPTGVIVQRVALRKQPRPFLGQSSVQGQPATNVWRLVRLLPPPTIHDSPGQLNRPGNDPANPPQLKPMFVHPCVTRENLNLPVGQRRVTSKCPLIQTPEA